MDKLDIDTTVSDRPTPSRRVRYVSVSADEWQQLCEAIGSPADTDIAELIKAAAAQTAEAARARGLSARVERLVQACQAALRLPQVCQEIGRHGSDIDLFHPNARALQEAFMGQIEAAIAEAVEHEPSALPKTMENDRGSL